MKKSKSLKMINRNSLAKSYNITVCMCSTITRLGCQSNISYLKILIFIRGNSNVSDFGGKLGTEVKILISITIIFSIKTVPEWNLHLQNVQNTVLDGNLLHFGNVVRCSEILLEFSGEHFCTRPGAFTHETIFVWNLNNYPNIERLWRICSVWINWIST